MSDNFADLDYLSIVLIWTAVAIYAVAFLAFTWDLATRAQRSADVRVASTAKVAVLAGGSGDTEAETSVTQSASTAPNRVARIGMALTVLGLLFHIGGVVLRGLAAHRLPWSNMYEFAMSGTALMVLLFVAVNVKYDLRFLGTFVTGLVAALLGGATVAFYVEVTPLADPLKSVWFVIHIFVATLATAFFALACGLSILQLMQARREAKAAAAPERKKSFLDSLPSAENLEGLAYRFSIVGFILWTFTLIAGSIWANDAWGRYWGFDTKEVWTFVIWVLYAGYIHARATRGWRGNRSAWLSIIGFVAVLFNYSVVNIFFKGLHAYSGLS